MGEISGRTSADLLLAVAGWLLNSNARISSGRHKGGIAGWLNEDSTPEFAYPEITGYFLSWLAFVSEVQPGSDLRSHAVEAVQWLASITTEQPPATRYYFDGRADWHNATTFTFDLAMICRGLHAVSGLVPAQPRAQLLNGILHHVLTSGSLLSVCLNAEKELPRRWATSPGPFQLKTVAALLPLVNVPETWRVYERWSGRVLAAIESEELHPALYAIEGLLQFGMYGRPEALREAAACFEELFPQGAFPDSIDTRSDAMAQALRVGCALHALGLLHKRNWKDRLFELNVRLAGFIEDSGAVLFRRPGERPVHYNAWSAMFTHQALWFHDRYLVSDVARFVF